MSDEEQTEEQGLSDADAEERASTLGWKSPDEWKGPPPPGGLVDAKTFLKKAEDALPVLRANNERLHAEIKEMRRVFDEFSQYHKQTVEQAERNAFAKAKAEILEQQKTAIKEGDADAFVAARQREDELAKQETVRFQPKPAQPAADDAKALQAEWEQANPWFNNDFRLNKTAQDAANFLARRNPNMPPREFLAEMTRLVKEAHPDHEAFGGKTMPSYDGGGRQVASAGRRSARTYESLPADAKAACDRFVDQNLMTRDQYLKSYPWD